MEHPSDNMVSGDNTPDNTTLNENSPAGSLEDDPSKKDSMIDTISFEGKQIILIGTAHVSKQSAQLVKETIHEQQPDVVCVELCQTRLASLKDADKWRNMDIVKVIKEKKALLLFINLLMASFQKKMADKFGIKPGQEMVNAVEAAEKIGARIVPSDREIQTTLFRLWRGMGMWEKLKFMVSLIFSIGGGTNEIEEADIEKMKQEDILQTLLADVKKSHPIIGDVLINERDQFLSEKIKTAEGQKIVAVVGAAHAPGIKKYLAGDEKIDLNELNQIPPAGKLVKILKWALPAAIMLAFVAGFLLEGKDTGADMIWVWIAANGIFAGLGAILALAHPFTILSSILAAPLTSLNPMIAAGWVSGLVEAALRKPKVKDLESIPSDMVTVKGYWKNNVIRILLVVIFTNLGSTIGTMTAIPLIAKLFGS